MADTIKLLLGAGGAELPEQVRALSDRIEIITSDELKANPALLSEIEVVYGGLARDQVPQAARLRWLQTGGAGVNGLITPEMRDSDLVITNASGIHAEPITEHMFGQLLQYTRRLADAWDQQKQRLWKAQDLAAGVSMLAGKTLGVLGVGAIGGHSARVGRGFGMRVIGLRRTREPHPDVEQMYSFDDALPFFRESDVIMNSAPLTDKTHHMVSWEQFAVMKPGAIILNTGRGGTINTEALMAALREGRIGAALLDVTDPEPLPEDHPLWTMENVYITPHYSGSHPEYWERANKIFLENLRRYTSGEPLMNVVDKHEGY